MNPAAWMLLAAGTAFIVAGLWSRARDRRRWCHPSGWRPFVPQQHIWGVGAGPMRCTRCRRYLTPWWRRWTARRRLRAAMPSELDMPRLDLSEQDIADLRRRWKRDHQ